MLDLLVIVMIGIGGAKSRVCSMRKPLKQIRKLIMPNFGLIWRVKDLETRVERLESCARLLEEANLNLSEALAAQRRTNDTFSKRLELRPPTNGNIDRKLTGYA